MRRSIKICIEQSLTEHNSSRRSKLTTLKVEQFIWDDANTRSLSDSGVLLREFFEMCQNRPLSLVDAKRPSHLLIVGPTFDNRMIFAVAEAAEDNSYYVGRARSAMDPEVELYYDLCGRH